MKSRSKIDELIKSVKNGDVAAFDGIIELYEPLISSMAKKYESSLIGYDFDDLKQEAVVALYSAAKTYDAQETEVTFGLYAKICIRNRLISLIRKNTTELACKNLPAYAQVRVDPEEIAVNKESYAMLMEAIEETLTSYERAVFKLYMAGTPYRAIAAQLDITQKSVDNAIYRIKSKIKKLI